MAVVPFTTYTAGQILTASSLNSSFSQVFNNGEDLGWPATKAKDLDGQELIFDVNADTSITADTADLFDFRVGGTDSMKLGWQSVADTGFLSLDPLAFTADATENTHRLAILAGNAITVPEGTTALASSLYVIEPNLTATGTITDAATIYIKDAPSEATNNYALLIAAGNARFAGGGATAADGILGKRNYLRNAGLRVPQRGTSFTSATTPANDDDTYLLDGWIFLTETNDSHDISQTTTAVDIADSAYAGINFDVETQDLKAGMLQIIESRDTAELFKAGNGVVSLSFDATTSDATNYTLVRAAVLAWDSTADAVTSDVVNVWGAEATNPTLVSNWTFENTPVALDAVTASKQRFKIENIACDTASTTNLAVFIWIEDRTNDVGDIMTFSEPQLEPGPFATPFVGINYNEDLLWCQRFMIRWDEAIDGGSGDFNLCAGNYNTTTSYIGLLTYPSMRASPTLADSGDTDFSVNSAAIETVSSGLSLTSAEFDRTRVNATTSTAIDGDGGILYIESGTSGFFELSAEL